MVQVAKQGIRDKGIRLEVSTALQMSDSFLSSPTSQANTFQEACQVCFIRPMDSTPSLLFTC